MQSYIIIDFFLLGFFLSLFLSEFLNIPFFFKKKKAGKTKWHFHIGRWTRLLWGGFPDRDVGLTYVLPFLEGFQNVSTSPATAVFTTHSQTHRLTAPGDGREAACPFYSRLALIRNAVVRTASQHDWCV